MKATRTPQSRLADDLYRLYLAALAWVLMPTYGSEIRRALPSSQETVDAVPVVIVVLAMVAAAWSGWRGGPLMVSRAAVVYELGSPANRVSVLRPQLLRQAIGIGAGAAVAAAMFSAMGPEFSWSASFWHSVIALFGCAGSVLWAVVWMVGRHGQRARPRFLLSAAILATAGTIAAGIAALGLGVNAGAGGAGRGPLIGLIIAVAASGLIFAQLALGFVDPGLLWRRANALESVRAAMLNADAHRVLTNMRRAGDQAAIGSRRLQRPWMPLVLWRFVAAFQHTLGASLVRLLAAVAASVVLVIAGDLSNGLVTAAFAICWLVVGVELTRSLAATADQVTFVLHYRRSSFWLLLGQLGVVLVIGAALIAGGLAWQLGGDDRSVAVGSMAIAGIAILAGGVQARLGSPNTVDYMNRHGIEMAQGLLWARAMAAPLILALASLVSFHEWINPDLFDLPSFGIIPVSIAAAAVIVTVNPLERETQRS